MSSLICLKKAIYIASLISFFSLVCGFSALGAKCSIGSEDGDWWINYPSQSPSAESKVEHPSFVLDALKTKPVVIYVHLNCSYCGPQTDAIAEVVKQNGTDFTLYDIAGDGSDSRSNETLVCDPNGNETNMPMTAIASLGPDQAGEVQVIWHSAEAVTGIEWI